MIKLARILVIFTHVHLRVIRPLCVSRDGKNNAKTIVKALRLVGLSDRREFVS